MRRTLATIARALLGLALAVMAVLLVQPQSRAQSAAPIPPPLSARRAQFFKSHPSEWQQFLKGLQSRPSRAAMQAAPRPAAPSFGGTWTPVTAAPNSASLSNPLLLTDGTVLVHDSNTPNWYKLTPDSTGSYVNGTWSEVASLPVINGTQYRPLYFASAVLRDGRAVIMGGEYNGGSTGVWESLGAIYDPAANTWTAVPPPSGSGWTGTGGTGGIGDASSIVLPDGTFLLSACCASPDVGALFDATELSWTSTGAPLGDNYQDEQGYTLLPTGKVLTIDIWNTSNPEAAEAYSPDTGLWSFIASTPVSLADPGTCGTDEIGPAVTRPDGTVVAFGGNTGCTGQADPTAIYDAAKNTWAQGPPVPAACGGGATTDCTLADAPAAMLPNGNILFAASAGAYQAPTHFFEFTSANAINQVADTQFFASNSSSYYYDFLVLPSGQVLETDFSDTAEVYAPTGSAGSSQLPVITSVPQTLTRGGTYEVAGTQLNGLSQGAAYGDDVQGATNYPLVLIVNNTTHDHFFAKTSGFSTMSIAPGASSTANFTLAPTAETGAATLYVIANGVSSAGKSVTIDAGIPLSVSEVGSGTVTSSPAGIDCPGTCNANFATGTPVTLNARAASGWRFTGWGGACSGTGACKVTVTASTSVTATFAQLFTLTVSKTGRGEVTSKPKGISCGTVCKARFEDGTNLVLHETPAAGWHFGGWSGACSGTRSCTVSVDAATSVSALFKK
jgi:hypothetical protein